MGEPATTALVLGTLLAAGTTAYQASQKPKTPKAPKPPAAAAPPVIAPQNNRMKQRRAASILTGPMGLTGEPTGTKKTLLGE